MGLFVFTAGTLGYVGAVAEYCWYNPNEFDSCASYQAATAFIYGAGWLVKLAAALAMIVCGIWYSRTRWIKQFYSLTSYSYRGNPTKISAHLKAPSITKRSQAYDEAVQNAALMLLASLRDYVKSPFSGPQLLRNRIATLRNRNCIHRESVHAVFVDIRERAADMLSAELQAANVRDEVAGEIIRALHGLLTSAEDFFSIEQAV